MNHLPPHLRSLGCVCRRTDPANYTKASIGSKTVFPFSLFDQARKHWKDPRKAKASPPWSSPRGALSHIRLCRHIAWQRTTKCDSNGRICMVHSCRIGVMVATRGVGEPLSEVCKVLLKSLSPGSFFFGCIIGASSPARTSVCPLTLCLFLYSSSPTLEFQNGILAQRAVL